MVSSAGRDLVYKTDCISLFYTYILKNVKWILITGTQSFSYDIGIHIINLQF